MNGRTPGTLCHLKGRLVFPPLMVIRVLIKKTDGESAIKRKFHPEEFLTVIPRDHQQADAVFSG